MWNWGSESGTDQNATVVESELHERIDEQLHLINELKDVIRENEERVKAKDKELEENNAKFNKIKLQNKAKVAQLTRQLQEVQNRNGSESGSMGSPHRKMTAHDETNPDDDVSSEGSHASHRNEQSRRGKLLLLKKQLDDSKLIMEKQERDYQQSKIELDEMVCNLYNQLSERDEIIRELRNSSQSGENQNKKEDPQVQEMYAQIVYKDNRILDLNNRILQLEGQVMDLQENVKEKDEVIQTRNKAIQLMTEDLSRRGKTVVDQLDDTRDEMRQMQNNFVSLESGWRDEKQRLIEEMEKFQIDATEKGNQLAELKESLSKMESSRFELNTRNAALQEKVVFLQQNLEKLKVQKKLDTTSNDNDSLQQELTALREKLNEKETTLAALRTAIKDSSSSKTADSKSVVKIKAQYVSRIKTLEKQLEMAQKSSPMTVSSPDEQLLTRITELEEERKDFQMKLMNFDDLKHSEEKYKDQVQELHEKVSRQSDDLTNHMRMITLLEREKLDLGEVLAKLRMDLTEVDVERTKLRESNAILQRTVTENTTTNNEDVTGRMTEEIRTLNCQLEAEHQLVRQTQDERQTLQEKIKYLEVAEFERNNRVTDLESQVSAAQEELETYRSQIAAKEAMLSDVSDKQSQVKALLSNFCENHGLFEPSVEAVDARFSQISQERSKLESDVREMCNRFSASSLEDLSNSIDGLLERESQLKKEIAVQLEDLNSTKNELRLMQVELEDFQILSKEEKNASNRLLQEITANFESVSSENENLKYRLREASGRTANLEEELSSARRSVSELQSELEGVKLLTYEAETRNGTLQTELNGLNTAILEKEEIIIAQQQGLNLAANRLEEMQIELENSKDEKNSLNHVIQEKQAELELLSSERDLLKNQLQQVDSELINTRKVLLENEESLKLELRNLNVQLSDTQAFLEMSKLSTTDEKTALNELLQEKINSLEVMSNEKEALKHTCNALKSDLSKMREVEETLKQQMTLVENELQTVQRKCDDKEVELEKLREASSETKAALNQMLQEKINNLELLLTEHETLKQQCNIGNEREKALMEEITLMKDTASKDLSEMDEKCKQEVEIYKEELSLVQGRLNEVQFEFEKLAVTSKEEKDSVNQELQRVIGKFEIVSNEKEVLKNQCDERTVTLKSLENELRDANDSLEKSVAHNELLKTQMECKLNSISCDREQELIAFQNRLMDAARSEQELQTIISDSRREKTEMEKRMTELEATVRHFETVVQDKGNVILQSEEEKRKINEECESLKVDVENRLQQMISLHEMEQQTMSTSLNLYKSQCNVKEKELDAKNGIVQHLEAALKTKMEETNLMNTQLQTDAHNIREALKMQKIQCNELKDGMRVLKEKLDSVEKDAEDKEKELAEAEKQVDVLRIEISRRDERILNLENMSAEKGKLFEVKDKEIGDTIEEISLLRTELASQLEKEEKEFAIRQDLESHVSQLSGALKLLEDELGSAKKELLEKLEAKRLQHTAELHEVNVALEELKTKSENLTSEKMELESKEQMLIGKTDKLTSYVEQLEDDLRNMAEILESSNNEKTDLEKTIGGNDRIIRDLENRCELLQLEMANSTAAYDSAVCGNKDLLEAIEAKERQIHQLMGEGEEKFSAINELREQNNRLMKHLEEKDATNLEMTANLNEKTQEITILTETQNRLLNIQGECESLRNANMDLVAQVENLELSKSLQQEQNDQLTADVNGYMQKIEHLEEKTKDLGGEIDNLLLQNKSIDQENRAKDDKITQMMQDLNVNSQKINFLHENTEDRVLQIQRENETLSKQNSDLVNQVRGLLEQEESLKQQNDVQAKEIQQLMTEVDGYVQKVSSLSSTEERLSDVQHKYESLLADLVAKLDGSSEENKRLIEEKDAKDIRINQLLVDVKSLDDNVAKVEAMLTELRLVHELLVKDHSDLALKNDILNQEIRDKLREDEEFRLLQNVCKSTEDELAALRVDLEKVEMENKKLKLKVQVDMESPQDSSLRESEIVLSMTALEGDWADEGLIDTSFVAKDVPSSSSFESEKLSYENLKMKSEIEVLEDKLKQMIAERETVNKMYHPDLGLNTADDTESERQKVMTGSSDLSVIVEFECTISQLRLELEKTIKENAELKNRLQVTASRNFRQKEVSDNMELLEECWAREGPTPYEEKELVSESNEMELLAKENAKLKEEVEVLKASLRNVIGGHEVVKQKMSVPLGTTNKQFEDQEEFVADLKSHILELEITVTGLQSELEKAKLENRESEKKNRDDESRKTAAFRQKEVLDNMEVLDASWTDLRETSESNLVGSVSDKTKEIDSLMDENAELKQEVTFLKDKLSSLIDSNEVVKRKRTLPLGGAEVKQMESGEDHETVYKMKETISELEGTIGLLRLELENATREKADLKNKNRREGSKNSAAFKQKELMDSMEVLETSWAENGPFEPKPIPDASDETKEIEKLMDENSQLREELEILKEKLRISICGSEIVERKRVEPLGAGPDEECNGATSDKLRETIIESENTVRQLRLDLENVIREKAELEKKIRDGESSKDGRFRQKEVLDSMEVLEASWANEGTWGLEGNWRDEVNKDVGNKMNLLMEENARLKAEMASLRDQLKQLIAESETARKVVSADLGCENGCDIRPCCLQLKHQLDENMNQLQNISDHNDQLQMSLSLVEDELRSVHAQRDEAKSENEELQLRIDDLNLLNEKMQSTFQEERVLWEADRLSNERRFEELGDIVSVPRVERESLQGSTDADGNVEAAIQSLKAEHAAYKEELDGLKVKNGKMLMKLKQLKDKNDRLQLETTSQQESLQRFKRDNSSLQDELLRFTDRVDTLEIANSNLLVLKEKLEKEIAKQRTKTMELSQQISTLNERVATLTQINERCLREASAAKEQTESLISDNNTFQTLAEDLREGRARLEEEMRQQALRLYHVNEEKERLLQELRGLRAAEETFGHDSKVKKEAEERCERLQLALQRAEDRVVHLEKENDATRSDKVNLELRIGHQEEGRSVRERELELQVEATKKEVCNLQEVFDELVGEKRTLQRLVEELQSEKERLQDCVLGLERGCKEHENAVDEASKLTNRAAELEQRLGTSTKEISKLQGVISHLKNLQQESGNKEHAELFKLVEQLQREKEHLVSAVGTLERKCADGKIIEDQLNNLEKYVSDLQATINRLQEELSECRSSLGSTIALNDNLKQQIESISADKQAVIQRLALSSSKLDRLNKINAALTSDFDQLKGLQPVQTDVECQLTAELKQTMQSLHQRDYRCEQLTEELSQLIDERDALQMRLSSLVRGQHQKEVEFEQLQRRLEEASQVAVLQQANKDQVLLNMEDTQPLIIPETSYTLTRTARGTAWRLSNWMQGRRNYLHRLFITKPSLKIVYYAYIIILHILVVVGFNYF